MEDLTSRTTVLTGQTFGMASTAPGRIEILLERNINTPGNLPMDSMYSVHSKLMLLTEVSDRVAHGDTEPILSLDKDFELKQHKAYPSILSIQLSDILEAEVLLFNLVVMGKRNVYNKFVREYRVDFLKCCISSENPVFRSKTVILVKTGHFTTFTFVLVHFL